MAVLLATCTLALTSVHAAPPDVEYLFPAGGRQGTTLAIKAGNKADSKIAPWPAKVWVDCAGIDFTPGKKPNTFDVTIASDAPPGPHLLRIYNDDGASVPRMFVVGRHPEILEKEPNDDSASAQLIADLPAAVNGTLEKNGDVDFYAVDLKAGEWVIAELECRRLGAPADPALRLVDENGVVVAFNHDTFGLDPLIAYRAAKKGRYLFQVIGFPYPPGSDIRFSGSKSTVYRLNLTTGPYARFSIPTCVPRGRKTHVKLFGWNLGARSHADPFKTPLEIEVDAASATADQANLIVSPTDIDNLLSLPLIAPPGRAPESPGATAELAPTAAIPATLDGRLESPGAVHCIAIDAKAKDRFTLIVRASSLNSPLDPMVVITDPAGKEISRDVGGGQDIRLDWSAGSAGRHVISLSDMKRAGGPDFVYHLELDRVQADFTARADAPAYRLEIGKTTKVQVTIAKLSGHSAPLKIEAVDLPEGVTASAAEIPAKGGAVALTLSAAADAKPANGPFHIIVSGTHKDSSDSHIAVYEPTSDLAVLGTPSLWLTVGNGPGQTAPLKTKK